jgi:hypothetical protein
VLSISITNKTISSSRLLLFSHDENLTKNYKTIMKKNLNQFFLFLQEKLERSIQPSASKIKQKTKRNKKHRTK